jgi:hypothetical protein
MRPERFTAAVMTKLRLSLNEAKTSIRDARKERFEFLGYSFGPHYWWKNGQRYMGASQSKKSVQWIKAKISELLVSGGASPHGSLLAMCLENWRSRSYARAQWTPAVGRTVTPVGKPDAGNQHVRFDERGGKRSVLFRAQPPRPSSTLLKPTEAEPSPTLHHARRRHQVEVLGGEFCPHFRMAGEPYQSIDRFPV